MVQDILKALIKDAYDGYNDNNEVNVIYNEAEQELEIKCKFYYYYYIFKYLFTNLL